ncbi:type II toxin-antitoxin system HicB family antitoxin [Lentilactobacillus buchneri]|uniref:HicB-like antitoxin of toxin-antitoxin system domain-containing protein n=1 Tax=Lentilactobacillus buchneri DSM 20057 TaxID=1423728 RepID=A0A4R5NSU3_LENBU|nr:type II toxin-antitoxin system HicB family antitoxin [Lentilactobacillus buchneri]WCJ52443.1 type II toxin-antitoxin system HicB family antitoxin [Lentilactobacillus sp. Egmn17]AEB74181.1 Uncharacterized protein family UPF0150 [Lentilactobacillus buchneri NRRL B-30929]KRK68198.1 hypothetical protein FC79_GL000732 [Lentilactobacillus buchneri DSM 20057]MCT2881525.1 HicB family protein [Lentilactobacillus buchneri]MCT2898434.1 HicB family protein [Lentilactobacillus buchneri]
MTNPEIVSYPAIFSNQDNDSYYTVTFPDIPDTVSQGRTLEEALREAPDAIAVALPDYAEYPKPSNLQRVQAENPNAIVRLVRVNMKEKLEAMRSKPNNIHQLFSGWSDDGIRDTELDWGDRQGQEFK